MINPVPVPLLIVVVPLSFNRIFPAVKFKGSFFVVIFGLSPEITILSLPATASYVVVPSVS